MIISGDLRSKKVLFIGAGASCGARETAGNRPPLGLCLVEWLKEKCPLLLNEPALNDLFSTLNGAMKILDAHPQIDNFEKLLSVLDRRDREVLHRTLQITFSDCSQIKRS